MATVIDPAAATGSQHVGKSALCRLLGWSRPTLDLRLETDSRFPVLQRGVRGGGWRFDAAAVLAYLSGDREGVHGPAGAEEIEQLADGPSPASKPPAMVVHIGEQSARQRRDAVQAEILEDKLRRDRSDLVLTAEAVHVLEKLQDGINRSLDQLCERVCDQLVARPDISVDVAVTRDVVRGLVDELREVMTANLKPLVERGAQRSNPRPAVG